MSLTSEHTASAASHRQGEGADRRARSALLIAILALTMLFGSVVVLAPQASAAPNACQSVGIYGVRGSGQTRDQNSGFGPVVWPAVQSLEQGLRAAGRTYHEFPLDYTAASTTLLDPRNNTSNYPWNVQQYLASVNTGRDSLFTLLDLRTRACPTETPVLIGYSQGSIAIRLTLQKLANAGRGDVLTRIAGAGLIADPAKQRNEPNIGNANALSQGVATQFRVGGAPVAIPPQVIGRAINACRAKDVVCDYSRTSGAGVHTSYQSTALPAQMGTWLVRPTVARSIAAPAPQPPAPQPPAPQPPAQGNPQVTLAQGPTAPAGYRYAVTLTGFPVAAAVSITCYDSVSPRGFYTFSLTTNGAGSASTSSYCYSGDGPDHWVTANGVQSNHVTWGGSAPPPPPPAATYAETTGSVANTWTNYTNAGGTQGPSIPSKATVQIACKITGFRVANGNTWWYQIASAPWNGSFYVSADAFYNNGQTSGSLAGTPFVDPNVRNC